MTVAEAEDWFRNNTTTETYDGTETVVYTHPEGETCPICGVEHEAKVVERVPLTRIAEQYHDPMKNAHADAIGNGAPVSDVAQSVRDTAVSNGTGHERFVRHI